MRVTPTGQSEYHEGNEVGRYGRDISAQEHYFCWYHDGLRKYDEPAWAMSSDVEWKISVSADAILVACQDGLYRIERDAFRESVEEVGDDEQLVARASDDFVTHVGDPNDHLQGHLWIESGNQVDENYHQEKGH
jgi:hypothetical protein